MVNPVVIWLTGLPSSGKTTLAQNLHLLLKKQGKQSVLIDGDEFRKSLASDLGFSLEDRQENVRRAAEMARMVMQSGVIAICSFISPTIESREQARSIVGTNNFCEVYVSTPLEVCIQRDAKGLYQKAREGKLSNLTGIDSPYEEPVDPICVIDTSLGTPQENAQQVLECLREEIS